jgi:oxygen-independent coproporphyrinogen-3 oxidase
MEEFMFLGLRKMDGISYAEFKKLFGCDIMSVYSAQIEKNCRNGLLEEYTTHGGLPYLRLTERGIDISNVVMSDFICQAD